MRSNKSKFELNLSQIYVYPGKMNVCRNQFSKCVTRGHHDITNCALSFLHIQLLLFPKKGDYETDQKTYQTTPSPNKRATPELLAKPEIRKLNILKLQV